MAFVIRLNESIRATEVRLIDHDGTMLGVRPIAWALARAREAGMQLVEVNPKATPPVCKIMRWPRGLAAIIGPDRPRRPPPSSA